MSLVVQCPNCKNQLSLPAGAKSGTFECPTCKGLLEISLGRSGSAAALSPDKVTWEALPPPLRTSTQAAQMGNQVWREASQAVIEAERRRIEEGPRPVAPRSNSTQGYRPMRRSTSPLVSCFAVIGVIALLGVAGIGIVIGVGVLAMGKSTMTLEGYTSEASGSKRTEKTEGDRQVVGVENRFTKSAFLMVSRKFPFGVEPDLKGYLDNLRLAGSVRSSRPIQRAGLSGIRYEFQGSSIANPSHTGEIFQIGNKVLILMYMPGSEMLRLQGRRSRYTEQELQETDSPEEFFESLKKAED